MQASSLECARVLVLNASYEPLRIVSWQRAILLLLGRKIDVLDFSDIEVHSPSLTLKLPSVVIMKSYILGRRIRRVARFSRQHVFMRDGHRCQYCHDVFSPKDLTLDHVVPVVRGGKKTWSNIVTCCGDCNQKKGCRTPQEAGFYSFKMPTEPQAPFLPDLLFFQNTQLPEKWEVYLEPHINTKAS